MTDTPLHRAARALMKSQSGVDDFDALDDEMQASLLDDVRAVLEALREPSPLMLTSAAYTLAGVTKEANEANEQEAWRIFRRMIDAALSE